MIRSRRPALDDADIVRLIRQELIPLNPPELRPEWSDRKVLKRVNQGTTFVWLPDEATVSRMGGFITLIPRSGELFIDMLALDRSTQGRGVGALLLNKAIKYGAVHGCSVMRLYVNDDNRRGIRFYQKHGMYPVWYDAQLRSYVMERRI
jgi:ribosomal protein S18 acetylase RimI-like enzyme